MEVLINVEQSTDTTIAYTICVNNDFNCGCSRAPEAKHICSCISSIMKERHKCLVPLLTRRRKVVHSAAAGAGK